MIRNQLFLQILPAKDVYIFDKKCLLYLALQVFYEYIFTKGVLDGFNKEFLRNTACAKKVDYVYTDLQFQLE